MSQNIEEVDHSDNISSESPEKINHTLDNCHDFKKHGAPDVSSLTKTDDGSSEQPIVNVKNVSESDGSKENLSSGESGTGASNLEQIDSLEPLATTLNDSTGK